MNGLCCSQMDENMSSQKIINLNEILQIKNIKLYSMDVSDFTFTFGVSDESDI